MATVSQLIRYIDSSIRYGAPLTRQALIELREVLKGMDESRFAIKEDGLPQMPAAQPHESTTAY